MHSPVGKQPCLGTISLAGLQKEECALRVAVVGSRSVGVRDYERMCMAMPFGVTEIVSGGARGADQLGKDYALAYGLKYTEFRPQYKLLGRAAPLARNSQIVDYADFVIALWDGKSRGTANVIRLCEETGTELKIIPCVG